MSDLAINNPVAQTTVQQVQNIQQAEKVAEQENVQIATEIPQDTFISSNPKKSSLTTAEKQEIVKNAKTKAAGWSCIFGIFDTLYYGLRSDKTIAKKFELNEETDKDLIKQIKQEQLKSTLPAAIGGVFGVGILTGLIGWLINKTSDPENIQIK